MTRTHDLSTTRLSTARLAAALAVALLIAPATAGAQVLRTAPLRLSETTARPLRVTPAPTVDAQLTATLRGSYGPLVEGEVTVSDAAGAPLARGGVGQELAVRASGPVDVAVTATGLVDRPTLVVRGVALPAGGGAMTVPVSIETGLIRAEARLGGRTVAGVVWLYRVDPATGETAATPCGSIGANTYGREISAGRYLAVLESGGTRLSRVVEIAAGTSRLVRLEG